MTEHRFNPDLDLMLDSLIPYREALRGVVEAFMADGFTIEQSRALTVNLMIRAQLEATP